MASKQGMWVKNLLASFGIDHKCIQLPCDLASTLGLVNNHVYHAHTKHIDIRYHKIIELVDSEELTLVKVPTQKNRANVLKKVLQKERHV